MYPLKSATLAAMSRKQKIPFNLTQSEFAQLRKLSTPLKIQAYLDTLPVNYEKKGDTHYSPRRVLRHKKAHCFEAALLAAAALLVSGKEPLILHLASNPKDDDHIVVLYKENGYFGAISKTNHATLRFRDPIFKNVRELALSYFHEYFLNTSGKKTLLGFSSAINLRRFGFSWITAEEDLFEMDYSIMALPHSPFIPKGNEKFIRAADRMERKAGKLVEWSKRDPRT